MLAIGGCPRPLNASCSLVLTSSILRLQFQRRRQRKQNTICCSVLGNSFHVFSISFLVTHLLDEFYGHPLNIPFSHFCWTGSLEAFEGKNFHSGPGVDVDDASKQQLVYEYLRGAERGGSDIRLDIQAPFRPNAWPRSGLQSSLWHWKIIMGHPLAR